MQHLCLLQLQGWIQNFPKGGVETHDTKSRVGCGGGGVLSVSGPIRENVRGGGGGGAVRFSPDTKKRGGGGGGGGCCIEEGGRYLL